MSNNTSGFIIINKPAGITSHDVIDKLRKITGIKRIGHAGTLDPFATGVLICAIGREATREISRFVKMDKEYEAEIRLGAVSDTYDRAGVIKKLEVITAKAGSRQGGRSKKLEKVDIKNVLRGFVGKQKQVPPMYSAKKVGGKRLYKLARAGIEIKRQPAEIEIYNIKILEYKWPILKIKIRCSSGTYIRSLAHDIGRSLNCGAYLKELERTAIGDSKIEKSVKLERVCDDWKKYIFK